MRLYRAEGSHEEPGYAGIINERTGRYFGSLARATKHLDEDRHLFEVDLTHEETLTLGGHPDDHVLLTPAQVERKRHSPRCRCHAEPTPDQSYCDVERHQNCSGYTEDEADPETCMCPCHDPLLASPGVRR